MKLRKLLFPFSVLYDDKSLMYTSDAEILLRYLKHPLEWNTTAFITTTIN